MLVPLVVAGAVLALAYVLNPSPERHRAEIRQAVGERHAIARVLKLGSVAALASRYHSIGLASYTTAGERMMSIGALGIVHVMD
jgi:hypothetical protein